MNFFPTKTKRSLLALYFDGPASESKPGDWLLQRYIITFFISVFLTDISRIGLFDAGANARNYLSYWKTGSLDLWYIFPNLFNNNKLETSRWSTARRCDASMFAFDIRSARNALDARQLRRGILCFSFSFFHVVCFSFLFIIIIAGCEIGYCATRTSSSHDRFRIDWCFLIYLNLIHFFFLLLARAEGDKLLITCRRDWQHCDIIFGATASDHISKLFFSFFRSLFDKYRFSKNR